jgi:hypothetical protein
LNDMLGASSGASVLHDIVACSPYSAIWCW